MSGLVWSKIWVVVLGGGEGVGFTMSQELGEVLSGMLVKKMPLSLLLWSLCSLRERENTSDFKLGFKDNCTVSPYHWKFCYDM